MKKDFYILFINISAFLLVFVLLSCKQSSTNTVIDDEPDYLKVPPGFPAIPFPADNPYSIEKVKLGRMLFYEKLLSRDSTIASCSHCMKQENAFCDNALMSIAYLPQSRNTMCLSNVAYRTILFWDGRGSKIESPALRSLFLPSVLDCDTNEIKRRLMGHPLYPKMFKDAFGPDAEPDAYLIAKAISTFVRTFVSGNSRYDKFINGDSSALNESEKRGMALFFGDRTKCSVCHSGFLFTDSKFHNTGTTTHYFDLGRWYVTKDFNDNGKFLTPSLRNVELTAPYQNDGQYFSLLQVIENYNKGGQYWENKDTLIKPLFLSSMEKNDLISFLKTLTDWDFINDPKFKKP
jgi:cytochrome c peroxidase